MAWTFEQQKAIDIRNQKVIVSAGAGSGKTAVLTERVFNIIKNKEAKVEELLILTFSNAAAHEMKERIIASLRREQLFEEADQVEGSYVTTFDAFSLYLVKKYGYIFSLSKDVEIIDENIIKIQEKRIISEIFNSRYQNKDPKFERFIKTFAMKSDEILKNYVIDILNVANLKVNKDEFLKNKCTYVFTDSFINQILCELMEFIKCELENYQIMCDDFLDGNLAVTISNLFQKIINTKNYDEFYNELIKTSLPRCNKSMSEDKKLKLAINESFSKLKKKIGNLGNKEEIINFIRKEQYIDAYNILFEMAQELDQKLWDFKLSKQAFTFQDIAKLAIRIAKIPSINQEIKKSFKFVMVDEYQDTSDLQEEFIQLIAGNDLFMVGDTKQSIYGFRHANCEIFQNKYENYKKGIGGTKIDLNFNFRSRPEVIDDLNKMFSFLMSKKYGAVDYKIDHLTTSGFKEYIEEGKTMQNQHSEIYNYDSSLVKMAKPELEARLIAQDIIFKINNHYQVYDKKSKQLRACTFSDFAILVDKKTHANLYQRIFDEYHLPLKVYKENELISSLIGNLFINCLLVINAIKNDNYDATYKHAMVGIMRSFVYNYTDNEIYDVVLNNNFKDTKVYQEMFLLAKDSVNLPLSQLILKIYQTLDIYNKLILIGDLVENEIILDKLLETAMMMEKLFYSLDEFVEYLIELKNNEFEMKGVILEQNNSTITMMSIHKSKGLEFPIIYFPLLNSNFYRSNSDNTLFKVSGEYGLILPVLDHDKDSYSNILSILNNYHCEQNTLSERIRLFYVALTRAKEKIILFNDISKQSNCYSISQAKSFQDLLNYFQSKYPSELTNKNVELTETSLDLLNVVSHSPKEVKFLKPDFSITIPEMTKRASKTISENTLVSELNYGTHLHYLFELVDLKTKDTSFIKNKYEKSLIDKVLKLDIFTSLNTAHIYKEFEFYDQANDVHGVIDLLIIYNDLAIIVDYKMKNIDDNEYVEQLKTYKQYVSNSLHLPVETYLLSILNCQLKKID